MAEEIARDDIFELITELENRKKPLFITSEGFVNEKSEYDKADFIDKNFDHIIKTYDLIPTLYAKTKRTNYKFSSDDMKHYVSKYSQCKKLHEMDNITNGAFIVAMMLRKFEWKRPEGSISCFFKAKRVEQFKNCKTCGHQKCISDYPKVKNSRSSKCEDCYKTTPRKKHKTGYDQIDDKVKQEINKYYNDGVPLKVLADKYNLTYANVFYWKKKGYIKKDHKRNETDLYQECMNMVPYTDFAENMSPNQLIAYCKECGFI